MATGRRQIGISGLAGRALYATLCAAATLALVLAIWPGRADAADPCGFQNGLGSFSATNQPGDCWRPYNDSSPFNRKIPVGAPTASFSQQAISGMLSGGDVSHLVFGDYQRDGGVATYWSKPSDPVYTLNCTKPWKGCALDGLQIHVPAQAVPTGGWSDSWEHDAHMTIIDQQTGWEYDMWQVWNESGNTLNFSWGGKTRIDGDGLGSDAVSARYGSIAGPIRPEELIGGRINHALSMVVPCTDSHVYPAVQQSTACSDAGLPASASVPMGAHLQLKMTKRQVNKLDVPPWKKAIVRALATYGAYVADGDGHWGFETATSESYTAYGQPDPWVQWAKSQGVKPDDFNNNGQPEYWFDLASGVPWNKLRFVDTCAAQGTCPVASMSSVFKKRAKTCKRGLRRWKRGVRRSETRSLHSGAGKRTRVRWENRCQRLKKRARHA